MVFNKNKIILTIVVDNYVRKAGLLAQHGWSIMITTGEEKMLFDTGQDKRIIYNLKKLGFTPNEIDKIFISHGHFDHTGGLYEIAKAAGRQIDLFGHPGIFDKKFKITAGFKKFYNGIPFSRETYKDHGIRFRMDKEPARISENISTTGEIVQSVSFEESEKNLMKRKNGFNRIDDFSDDTGVIIETKDGIILITGCAHRGIINSIRQAQRISGKEYLTAVIGGFHLHNKKQKYIDKTISELKKINIGKIIPSHCTGIEGHCSIKKEFGDRCEPGYTGKKIVFTC
jgi:7,8-dihydropterin-6-yl-methyl-4-(beta-D-ribofuranosyl)aminobenzene 5'-phosphate synthase